MCILDELAAFVTSARAADLPSQDRAILRRHVADIVAARIAGAACSDGKAVAAFYSSGEGADRIAGLATLVRLTETDDIHTLSGTTPSSVVASVALALAASCPCPAERLESAVFVGLEAIVRLGMAIGGAKVLYLGVWPTRAGATLGAAAAASRVLGLTLSETRNALSMAVLLTAGRTGRFLREPSARWILFANAVSAGVGAALAARAGFAGDLSVLDGNWLERSLGVPVDTQELVRDLGRSSALPQLSLKPYCTSRQALPGAEAMRALVAEGLDPAGIDGFTIKVPTAYAQMIAQTLDPAVRATTYVSGAGLAAIAALAPASLYDLERAGVFSDARIMALAAKGEVVADASLDDQYPARWPARLEVKTSAGTLHREMLEPLGAPASPMSDEALEDKARRVLTSVGHGDVVAPFLALARGPFASDASAMALARLFSSGRVA